MVYYSREYEEENRRQKKTRENWNPSTAVRPTPKQPEKKMPRGTQVKRDGLVITVERSGHLKQDCRQASKQPPAPCLICKGPYWRRDCPPKCRPQGSDSQDNLDWRCPGVPTQATILITPEEPWVLVTVWANQSIFFWTVGQFSLCSLKPLVHFPPDPLL